MILTRLTIDLLSFFYLIQQYLLGTYYYTLYGTNITLQMQHEYPVQFQINNIQSINNNESLVWTEPPYINNSTINSGSDSNSGSLNSSTSIPINNSSIPKSTLSNIQLLDNIGIITLYLNKYRTFQHSASIKFNETLASYAQNWSDYLLASNQLIHRPNNIYGENLYQSQFRPNDVINQMKAAIDSWYNEIDFYNFSNPIFSPLTGHFTQLVWNSSTQYGCGYSYDNITETCIIVINFLPRGNIDGQYENNVFIT